MVGGGGRGGGGGHLHLATPDIGRLRQHKKCTTEVESVKVLSWSEGGGGEMGEGFNRVHLFFTFAGIKICAEMRERGGGGGRENKFTS